MNFIKLFTFVIAGCLIMSVLTACNSSSSVAGARTDNVKSDSENESSSAAGESGAESGAEYSSQLSETNLKIIDSANNSTTWNDLITKELDIDLFAQKYCTVTACTLKQSPLYIQKINSDFGVECLRKTGDGTFYSVHKVKQGGLLYIFYVSNKASDPSYSGKDEDYLWVQNWFYVKKHLSYSDFSSIQLGSSISSVEKIDPTTELYKKHAFATEDTAPNRISAHYLSDGILTLFYKFENGDYVVDNIEYKADFQINRHFYPIEYLYNGHILSMDYIEK